MLKRIKYKHPWHYVLEDEVEYEFAKQIQPKHVTNVHWKKCNNGKWLTCGKCGNQWCYPQPPKNLLFCICNSKVIVKPGYAWDGPSGPTIDTEDSMRASLIHDVLYQAIREGALETSARKWADKEFLEILKQDGMPWVRRNLWYRMVRWFGASSAQP